MSSPTSQTSERPGISLVLFGPAGCGKSTIGRAVAARSHACFVDADDFHTDEAIAKMEAGEALTDADRLPWLHRLARYLHEDPSRRIVLACSALKERYRQILAGDGSPGIVRPLFVYLEVPPDVLAQRLATRREHFAGPALLESQLQTLEPPSGPDPFTGVVDAAAAVDVVVERVCAWVRQAQEPSATT